MEQVFINEMERLGFSKKIGDIFLDWENVKDELLEADKKTGSGNGTIHVFLGKEGYGFFQNLFPNYFNHVKATNETVTNAPKIRHFFSKTNLISSIGHVCNYYVQKGKTEKVIELVTKVATKLNEKSDNLYTSESLFKWSTGSNDLRPYFKQFDENFQKIIRPLLLPNSAYKISLFQNENEECAAFWLLGFKGVSDCEMVADAIVLQGNPGACVCRTRKLTDFILKTLEYFKGIDRLDSIVSYAVDVPANKPIKVSKDGAFSLVGMFIETNLDEIKKRNNPQVRWFENLFSLGNRNVYLSTQWNANGNYQLTLPDFEKLIQTCYGEKYYYKLGQNGEHELWLKGASNVTPHNYSYCSPLQRIIYGAPGTGKSFSIKTVIANHLGVMPDKIDMEADYIFRTTFHPDYDYAQFVGCYKPAKADTGDITYEFSPQVFTNALIKSFETNNPVYLVIEEINRGNCAQIFGDLFQLLDRNSQTGVSEYSINADEDMKIYLEKHCPNAIKDGKIKLPGNFNIIATMNTSDQSLFPMDSAFKRRWEWVYEPIKYDTKFVIKVDDKHEYNWCDFQKEINQKILDKTFSEDKQMGDYFIKTDVSLDNFINKVMFYLWNDICKENFRTDDNFFRTKDEKSEDTPEFSFGELMNDKVNKVVGFMDYLGVANSKKSLIENPQSGNDTSDGVVEA